MRLCWRMIPDWKWMRWTVSRGSIPPAIWDMILPIILKITVSIERLEGKTGEERSARFVCAIAACFPDGRVLTTRGTMEGQIGYEEKGENGFGYDPGHSICRNISVILQSFHWKRRTN